MVARVPRARENARPHFVERVRGRAHGARDQQYGALGGASGAAPRGLGRGFGNGVIRNQNDGSSASPARASAAEEAKSARERTARGLGQRGPRLHVRLSLG